MGLLRPRRRSPCVILNGGVKSFIILIDATWTTGYAVVRLCSGP